MRRADVLTPWMAAPRGGGGSSAAQPEPRATAELVGCERSGAQAPLPDAGGAAAEPPAPPGDPRAAPEPHARPATQPLGSADSCAGPPASPAPAEQQAAVARVVAAQDCLDLSAVVGEMKAHAGAAHVQQAGCRALQRLAVNARKAQAQAAREGAIEAVLSAMSAHLAHAGVQSTGCAALWSLAADAANKQAAVDAGAVAAVVAAIRTHADVTEVQKHGLRALHALVSEAPPSWRDLAAGVEDAAAALVAAEAHARQQAHAALTHACVMLVGAISAAGDGLRHMQTAVRLQLQGERPAAEPPDAAP